MANKKISKGEFANLFIEIKKALSNVKNKFVYFPDKGLVCLNSCIHGNKKNNDCKNLGRRTSTQREKYCNFNSWLQKVHKSLDFVRTVDVFIWLTFWLGNIWEKDSQCNNWENFYYYRCPEISTYTGASPKSDYSVNLNHFLKNPLTSGIKPHLLMGRIKRGDIGEDMIQYAGWVLYNEFFCKENGELIAYPKGEDDSFFKPLLILWKLFFNEFSDKNEQMRIFLKSVDDIVQTSKEKLYTANTADKLSQLFDVPAKEETYKQRCEKAAKIFWGAVQVALDAVSSEPVPVKCIYSLGGTMSTENQISQYDAYNVFNSNHIYQNVLAALMQDFCRINRHEPPIVDKNCTEGELLLYLSFFNKLNGLQGMLNFRTYLGDAFAIALNNPVMQNLYLTNKPMFTHLQDMYTKYFYETYLDVKLDNTSDHEFISAIPLVRYNFEDAIVVNDFISTQEFVEFMLHKCGERFGKFKMRYADKSDIHNLLSIQNDDEPEDKAVFIRAKEKEIKCAIEYRQLIVIEDLHCDTDCVGKELDSETSTDNPVAGFAILCPEILPYSEKGNKPGTVSYNGKIIEKLNERGESEKAFCSFNTCFIASTHRGIGLQRLFLLLLEKLAVCAEKKGIVCTVSELNFVSYKNFQAAGYEKVDKVIYEFEGVEYPRDFLELRL